MFRIVIVKIVILIRNDIAIGETSQSVAAVSSVIVANSVWSGSSIARLQCVLAAAGRHWKSSLTATTLVDVSVTTCSR